MAEDVVDSGGRIKTLRVTVTGRVQGVWFRAWTAQEAEARRLAGWVRNRRDGSVEALFSGPPKAVDEMVGLCSSGPPAAQVRSVAAEPAPPPDGPGFRHLPTL